MKVAVDPFTRQLMLAVDELTQRVAALEGRTPAAEKEAGAEIVLGEVSRVFLLPVAALKSNSRSQDVVAARWSAMLLMNTALGMSTNRIGRLLGGKDHHGVRYGCDQLKERLIADVKLRAQFAAAELAVELRLEKVQLP